MMRIHASALNPGFEGRQPYHLTRWRGLLTFLPSLCGAGLCFYSLAHHRALRLGEDLSQWTCEISAAWSCETVARSPWSEVGGIPLGGYGLGFFALLLLSNFAFLGAKTSFAKKQVSLTYLWVLSVLGCLASLFLGWISLVQMGTGCLVCVSVYGCIGAQTVLLWRNSLYRGVGLWRPASGWLPLLDHSLTLLFLGALTLGSARLYATYPASKSSSVKHTVSALSTALGPSLPEPLFAPEKVLIPIVRDAKGLPFSEDDREGADNAPAVLVVFSDYQCPSCRYHAALLKELLAQYSGALLVVYKHFPFDHACNSLLTRPMHQGSCMLAEVSRCAGEQKRFHVFHELVYRKQQAYDPGDELRWAAEAGVEQGPLQICLSSGRGKNKVQGDLELAYQIGVRATPTFFMNGRRLLRTDLNSLREATEQALAGNL